MNFHNKKNWLKHRASCELLLDENDLLLLKLSLKQCVQEI